MKFKVKVKNTVDLGIIGRSMRAIGDSAARRGNQFLYDRMCAYCPVDTGYLQSSIIQVENGIGSYSVLVTAGYAAPVEYGHASNGTWVPPNPFARRAIQDLRAAFPSLAVQAKAESLGGGALGVFISR